MEFNKTLVLDAAWQPINIIDVEQAFSMIYSDRAQALEEHSYGPCALFLYPSVIRCKTYVRKKPIDLPASRINIYLRDNYSCQYCGEQNDHKDLTLDHVIPKSRGGQKGWFNLVSCCKPCNQRKRDKTPSEASMELKKKPAPMKFDVLRLAKMKTEPPTNWRKFLGEKNV